MNRGGTTPTARAHDRLAALRARRTDPIAPAGSSHTTSSGCVPSSSNARAASRHSAKSLSDVSRTRFIRTGPPRFAMPTICSHPQRPVTTATGPRLLKSAGSAKPGSGFDARGRRPRRWDQLNGLGKAQSRLVSRFGSSNFGITLTEWSVVQQRRRIDQLHELRLGTRSRSSPWRSIGEVGDIGPGSSSSP